HEGRYVHHGEPTRLLRRLPQVHVEPDRFGEWRRDDLLAGFDRGIDGNGDVFVAAVRQVPLIILQQRRDLGDQRPLELVTTIGEVASVLIRRERERGIHADESHEYFDGQPP